MPATLSAPRSICVSSGRPTAVSSWLGDSRGRWDGDTLVVETTNLRSSFLIASAALRLTERFTRVGPNTLQYQVTVEDPKVLSKRGGNYFRSVSGTAPAPASQAEIRQGQLEKGNADSVHSASRLVTILRQFEALQKAMTIGADMNRRAVEDVAKVG